VDAKLPVNDDTLPTTGRRLQWAQRLTDGSHPLVARVHVNRIWMHHFGRGIVNTPGDFGLLGDRPTHPELLDWLASELVSSGWSQKHLHRLIMTSNVYRQQGIASSIALAGVSELNDGLPAPQIVDPDNTLYWHFPIRRLDAETLRDSMLSVSGLLNDRRTGSPVPVMADIVGQWVIGKENLNAGRPGPVLAMNTEEFRKTIFVQWRRSRPLTVLDTFDLPKMEPNCERRNSSTVASQSLFLMNSDFIVQMAEHFAARVRREVGTNAGEQVRHAWRIAFVRNPADNEINEALKFLDAQTEQFKKKPVETKPVTNRFDSKAKNVKRDAANLALANLCQLLLSSNEFLYVD
jgi:hypothetical protein